MSEALAIVLRVSIAVHAVLIVLCAVRTWRGENAVDRLLGADLIGALTVAVLVLLSLSLAAPMYVDIALAIAALGVIGTIALARHMAGSGRPQGGA